MAFLERIGASADAFVESFDSLSLSDEIYAIPVNEHDITHLATIRLPPDSLSIRLAALGMTKPASEEIIRTFEEARASLHSEISAETLSCCFDLAKSQEDHSGFALVQLTQETFELQVKDLEDLAVSLAEQALAASSPTIKHTDNDVADEVDTVQIKEEDVSDEEQNIPVSTKVRD